MDRVATLLAAILVITATCALLGAQGARMGPFAVPSLSPWWVVGAALLVLLLTPRKGADGSEASRDRGTPGGTGAAVAGGLFLLSFLALLLWRHEGLHPKASLEFVVSRAGSPRAGSTRNASSLQIERRSELRRLAGLRHDVELETSGLLEVPRSGAYRFDLSCDDSCEMEIGTRVLEAHGEHTETLSLEAGEVPFSLRYRQGAGPARLVVRWTTPALIQPLPIDYYVRPTGGARRSRWPPNLALAALVFWFGGFSFYLSKLGRARSTWLTEAWVPVTLASLLMVYGTALRLEALLAHSGLAQENDRAAEIHESLLPFLPTYSLFNPDNAPDDPYRADVRSYLDRAESMSLGGFYAPSFREPFYPLLVRGFVSLLGGEIGILVESFVFSALTLPLFYFVARALHGNWWAAALLVPVSLHEWLVLEAPTGYRESAYAFFLIGFVSFVALGKWSRWTAVAGGALGGLVCLIRLTALSVVAPIASLWALERPVLPRRRLWIHLSMFASALAVVVAPFLWSNYRAHGDPLFSVSFHTQFWLRAEGIGGDEGPVSLTRYFTDFGPSSRLVHLVRGTLLGMTVLPLRTFWNGLRLFPLLGIATLGLGAPGLILALRDRARFLPAAYLGHLIPFAYIQNFPSGEMPRFVMPAFFFLVLSIPLTITALARVRGNTRI